VAAAVEHARERGRDDLAARLGQVAERVARTETVVCVVGEFKKGKSALINALLGRPVCPVDDDLATTTVTVVRYAGERVAMASARAGELVSGDPGRRRRPLRGKATAWQAARAVEVVESACRTVPRAWTRARRPPAWAGSMLPTRRRARLPPVGGRARVRDRRVRQCRTRVNVPRQRPECNRRSSSR
jgi:hypothetical protein